MDKRLYEKIEDLGWSIEEYNGTYYLGMYSPAGQDFTLEIEYIERADERESVEEFIDNIYEYYESYDVSEEAYIWIDSSGHGVNGAPHELKDVVEDMEACERNMIELYNQLVEWYDEEYV